MCTYNGMNISSRKWGKSVLLPVSLEHTKLFLNSLGTHRLPQTFSMPINTHVRHNHGIGSQTVSNSQLAGANNTGYIPRHRTSQHLTISFFLTFSTHELSLGQFTTARSIWHSVTMEVRPNSSTQTWKLVLHSGSQISVMGSCLAF